MESETGFLGNNAMHREQVKKMNSQLLKDASLNFDDIFFSFMDESLRRMEPTAISFEKEALIYINLS